MNKDISVFNIYLEVFFHRSIHLYANLQPPGHTLKASTRFYRNTRTLCTQQTHGWIQKQWMKSIPDGVPPAANVYAKKWRPWPSTETSLFYPFFVPMFIKRLTIFCSFLLLMISFPLLIFKYPTPTPPWVWRSKTSLSILLWKGKLQIEPN